MCCVLSSGAATSGGANAFVATTVTAQRPRECVQTGEPRRATGVHAPSRCHGHWCHAAHAGAKKKKHHLSKHMPSSHCLKLGALPFVQVDKGLFFFRPFATSWRLVSHLPGACSLIMDGNADTVRAIFNLESVDVSACRSRPQQKHWHEYPGSAGSKSSLRCD